MLTTVVLVPVVIVVDVDHPNSFQTCIRSASSKAVLATYYRYEVSYVDLDPAA